MGGGMVRTSAKRYAGGWRFTDSMLGAKKRGKVFRE
jgi:hypothetical protein